MAVNGPVPITHLTEFSLTGDEASNRPLYTHAAIPTKYVPLDPIQVYNNYVSPEHLRYDEVDPPVAETLESSLPKLPGLCDVGLGIVSAFTILMSDRARTLQSSSNHSRRSTFTSAFATRCLLAEGQET